MAKTKRRPLMPGIRIFFTGDPPIAPEHRQQFVRSCMETARERTRILLIFLFLLACYALLQIPEIAREAPRYLPVHRIGAYWVLVVSVGFSFLFWRTGRVKELPLIALKITVRGCWYAVDAGILLMAFVDVSMRSSLTSFMLFTFMICIIPIASFVETMILITGNIACMIIFCVQAGTSFILWQQAVILYILAVWTAHMRFVQVLHLFQEQMHMQQRTQELSRLSETDQLTGLLNRRGMENRVLHTPNFHRAGEHIGVLMVDIDLFKRYNDKFQHLAGDDCLVRVADCLALCARRASDVVARYGGEEFVIILKGLSEQDLIRIAQRVRASVEELRIPFDPDEGFPVVTVSVGVSHTRFRAGDKAESMLKQMIDLADQELYNAKNNGRNCVSFNGRVQPVLRLVTEVSSI